MKTHVLRTSILALLVAAAGHAESFQELHANIPFGFVASGATLAAGEYTVNQSISGVIELKSGKGGVFVRTTTVEHAGVQKASKLVFHRYGSTYVLSQIWTRGDVSGRQTPVTRRERELAKNRAPEETIILAMR